jgi:hypothetical protein
MSKRLKLALLAMVSVLLALLGVLNFVLGRQPSFHSNNDTQQPSFSFAAVGDFGASEQALTTLDTLARQHPDFTLGLGDITYGSVPETTWCNFVTSRLGSNYPFELVVGNHDTDEEPQLRSNLDKLKACLPNRMPSSNGTYGEQYYFDYKNLARIIAIEPDIGAEPNDNLYDQSSADYKWLVGAIDDAREKNIPWIVVAMHKNCITIGQKKCEIGQNLFKLLVDKKVDLILQAHEHAYMRSKLLVSEQKCDEPSKPTIPGLCTLDTIDNVYPAHQGSMLIINGTGGAPLRNLDPLMPDGPYFATWHALNKDQVHGPTIFQIWPNKLQAKYINVNNKIWDSFALKAN